MQVSDDAFIARDLLHFNHHPNVSVYYPGAVVMDLDEHLQDMRLLFSTYSDIAPHNHNYRVLFGEGDWTVALTQLTATNDGPLPNATGALLSPTMRTVKAGIMTIAHWNGGLIMEEYLWVDTPKMWRQLGLLPSPPAAELPDLELSPYTAPLTTHPDIDSSTINKEMMKQTDEAFNAGKFEPDSMNLSSNITIYGFNDEGLDLQGFLDILSSYKVAFPNLRLENQQTIGQGDWIATISHLSGTHQGPLMLPAYLADGPLAATNKSFDLLHYTISRWQEGKIVAMKVNIDTFGILGALGISL